jgi:hypothetical protein
VRCSSWALSDCCSCSAIPSSASILADCCSIPKSICAA